MSTFNCDEIHEFRVKHSEEIKGLSSEDIISRTEINTECIMKRLNEAYKDKKLEKIA